ncbi:MAG TPA: hypothetical protein DD727_01215, partial [Clostridiales bacterium]|nr:hypothetical protein [Clostridiales bacterium]
SAMFRVAITQTIEIPLLEASLSEIPEPPPRSRGKADPLVFIYFTQPGDTIWGIAKKYRIPLRRIQNMNPLRDENLLPGTQIIITG